MGCKYQAMPTDVPAGPDVDGIANIRFQGHVMVLELAGGETAHVPFDTIARGGIRVLPGSDTDVNRVQVEFLAAEIEFGEDTDWTEAVKAKRNA